MIAARAGETIVAAAERMRGVIEKSAVCNVALAVSLSSFDESTRTDVRRLCAATTADDQRLGICQFSLAVRGDVELLDALATIGECGALAHATPESDGQLVALLERKFTTTAVDARADVAVDLFERARPAMLEAERVHRVAALAQLADTPLLVHSLSSSDACRAVAAARQRGAVVFAHVPAGALAVDSRAVDAPLTRVPTRRGSQHAADALELLAK